MEEVCALVGKTVPAVSEEVKIADTFGFLEGNGKLRRHIKLHTPENIEAKHLAGYLALGLQQRKKTAD